MTIRLWGLFLFTLGILFPQYPPTEVGERTLSLGAAPDSRPSAAVGSLQRVFKEQDQDSDTAYREEQSEGEVNEEEIGEVEVQEAIRRMRLGKLAGADT